MWKKIICLFILTVSLCLCLEININAGNEITNEPYETKILGLEGKLVSSSMAYEGINVLNLGFTDPQDIFIDNDDVVYVADKGSKVVYKYNPRTNQTTEIGKGVLTGPTGVCVDENGLIYVADKEKSGVYIFDKEGVQLPGKDGKPLQKPNITKPTEALFGDDSLFTPTKVAVDRGGNLYITSEGNANGLVQINKDGSFVGYFGRNTTTLTFDLMFKRMFASKEDRDTVFSLAPKPTTNLAIDSKNIVYTVIANEEANALKKYNINGSNLMGADMLFSDGYKDIAVDNEGYIYTVSDDRRGVISVRDNDGNILFSFGNTGSGSVSMGYFVEACGVDVDASGNIWVLDRVGKNLQVFTKTKFANTVMEAMNLYKAGEYELAEVAYHDIIAQNSSFVQAYIGLGNIAQRNQEYQLAREYYRIANHKTGYSDAFWELRDEWLSRNLLWIAIVVLALVVLHAFKVKDKILAKTGLDLEPIKKKITGNSYYKEFSYLPKMLKNPNDTIYDIKFLQKIRFSTALIFFVLFVVINIACDTMITGYIFKEKLESQVNIAFELLKWGLIIILIVVGNHLVSSLQKGEGFFRDIFIGVMVAFAPLFLMKLPLAIISNVLTFNEGYIFSLVETVFWIWSIFNVILVIKVVHNYTLKELIVNIVLTAVAVIILVFLFLMVYILFMQFYQFIVGLIMEAIMR